MTPTLKLADPPDSAAKAAAGKFLYTYNIAQTGVNDRQPIGAVAANPATGKVVGGLWRRIELEFPVSCSNRHHAFVSRGGVVRLPS